MHLAAVVMYFTDLMEYENLNLEKGGWYDLTVQTTINVLVSGQIVIPSNDN
ncbi:hypothetical protein [Candidatus Sororendozoicomonas aggregata]|uniref:hypothetical protein n=1 Tax=Candidatus Sororendozoicomonas aggregata TaxID=3073239 RepID=UPI002ED556AD